MFKNAGVLVFGLFWLVFLAAPAQSQAVSLGGLGIRPAYPNADQPLSYSWFIYELLPGETKNDAVIVSNSSQQTLSARLYGVDAITTSDGAFALLGEKEGQKQLGSWVKLDLNKITLAPGEEQIVPFSLAIPSEAEAGDHLGGIVLENLKPKKTQGVDLITRVGVRIYQTVLGEIIEKLSLVRFEEKTFAAKPVFYLELKNEGNVRLYPQGKLRIKEYYFGKEAAAIEIASKMVMPQKSLQIPLTWERPWWLGKFVATAEISYGEEKQLSGDLVFFYFSSQAKWGFCIFLALMLKYIYVRFNKAFFASSR